MTHQLEWYRTMCVTIIDGAGIGFGFGYQWEEEQSCELQLLLNQSTMEGEKVFEMVGYSGTTVK